jgi:hypothetical protein
MRLGNLLHIRNLLKPKNRDELRHIEFLSEQLPRPSAEPMYEIQGL